ncbi:MAG: NAD-dependent epimerase/dehydratase family protein [Chitinophagaceae bacterium]|nr:NAD-dependent epimerase/dehydratase family protein [Chitinophagaceae bacterium]
MPHYIVTGGAGFIGSNLIKDLFRANPGIKITCIDNFDPFYPADIKQFNIRELKDDPHFHFLYCDLATTSANELAEMITEPVDAIIHLAAKAGVRPSIQNPMAYQQVNVIGLQNLLEFAKQKKIKQFVFASSSSVYGINDHFPWKENETLLPVSPYAMTKQAGEMLGHVYSKLFDIRFIALRIFTAYGPAQRPDLAIHKFIKAILRDEPITMYGDGSTSRDYTFVSDIVSGIMAAVKYDKTDFEIINLGNNYSIPLKELIKTIEEVIGKQAIIEQLPEQAGDVSKTFADITKAKTLLGYDPQTNLKGGIAKFYEWFKKNEDIVLRN